MFSMRVAVANQYACRTILEADKAFEESCNLCCNSPRCLHTDCRTCRVQQMHDAVVAMMQDNIEPKGVA